MAVAASRNQQNQRNQRNRRDRRGACATIHSQAHTGNITHPHIVPVIRWRTEPPEQLKQSERSHSRRQSADSKRVRISLSPPLSRVLRSSHKRPAQVAFGSIFAAARVSTRELLGLLAAGRWGDGSAEGGPETTNNNRDGEAALKP